MIASLSNVVYLAGAAIALGLILRVQNPDVDIIRTQASIGVNLGAMASTVIYSHLTCHKYKQGGCEEREEENYINVLKERQAFKAKLDNFAFGQ